MTDDLMTGRDIEYLALVDPDEYERLLHSYTLLLGKRGLWWERVAENEDERWKRCIRRAITKVAQKSALEPHRLAEWLDFSELPLTRALVLSLARADLKGRA